MKIRFLTVILYSYSIRLWHVLGKLAMTYATWWHHSETFPTFTWLRNTSWADSPRGADTPRSPLLCIQKLGRKYCLFLAFFALGKLGVAHGRMKINAFIRVIMYNSSLHHHVLNLCLVKKFSVRKLCLSEIGFFRPILFKMGMPDLNS